MRSLQETIQIAVRVNPFYQFVAELERKHKDIHFSVTVDVRGSDKQPKVKVFVHFKFWREKHLMMKQSKSFIIDNQSRLSHEEQSRLQISELWQSFTMNVFEQAITNDYINTNKKD